MQPNRLGREALWQCIRAIVVVCSTVGLVGYGLSVPTPVEAIHVSEAQADGASATPILLANQHQTIGEGHRGWLALPWTTKATVENLTVKAGSRAEGVQVHYQPDDLLGATLEKGRFLQASEIDTTMIHLDTTTAAPIDWTLDLEVGWEVDGETFSARHSIAFTKLPYDDAPLQAVTTEARVRSSGDGAENWIVLEYLGVERAVTDFEVVIEGTELPIDYTDDVSSGLHHDNVLEVDEVDQVRIWLDPERIEPGVHHVSVSVRYTSMGQTVRRLLRHSLSITVI